MDFEDSTSELKKMLKELQRCIERLAIICAAFSTSYARFLMWKGKYTEAEEVASKAYEAIGHLQGEDGVEDIQKQLQAILAECNSRHDQTSTFANKKRKATSESSASATSNIPSAPPEPSSRSLPSVAESQPFTPEQQKLVNQILEAKDYGGILQFCEGATEGDLKKAYKMLALKLHPEKNKAPKAHEAMVQVNDAFLKLRTMSDGERRTCYILSRWSSREPFGKMNSAR